MSEVRNLEPKIIWNHFENLNAVPRPSKKEERVIQFMVDFGKSLGLETIKDEIGNVIIKKPATSGMESKPTVILQAHLDMVHQKNNDTHFDFDQQGIDSCIDGEWVTAKGTTLGADNGMGVAGMMAVLSSDDIQHPAIEALFTIDEETGMTGAKELNSKNLSGTILLNLDTEDDDELSVGCAGGIDTNVVWHYEETNIPNDYKGFELVVKGLKGGHSGMDIHLERGNANKIMNRLLLEISKVTELKVQSVDGGSLRNAIPRESVALVAVDDAEQLIKTVSSLQNILKNEYHISDPGITLLANEKEVVGKCMSDEAAKKMIQTICAVFNGVYRMSQDIEGLVETSSSLARVEARDGKLESKSLQRSSVDSAKTDLAQMIKAQFELMGAEVEQTGDYPGWQPNLEAPIVNTMIELYRDMFDDEPKVKACHAGLECGILGKHLPQTDMISFGPTIRNPHSPDEKVKIESVQKYWKYLTAALENIPG